MSDSRNNRPPDQPPPRPWKKGEHGSHSVAVVEVHICRDALGRVYSYHRPQDKVDETVLREWPSGGLEQAAFAMLCEAVQREAILGILMSMTQDPDFLEGDWDDERVTDLASKLQTQMGNSVERLADKTIRTVIHRFKSQEQRDEGG